MGKFFHRCCLNTCLVLVLFFSVIPAAAEIFNENFDNSAYKDTTLTSSSINWPAVYDSKNVAMLKMSDMFAETSGVTVWGGGARAIEYDSGNSRFLIGGEAGKINEYNGSAISRRMENS